MSNQSNGKARLV